MKARLTLSLAAVLALHAAALCEQPGDGKEAKDDRGYVKALVEIKGQLSPVPDAKPADPTGGFVRVGDGFGLQVFRLDWSAAPDLREQPKKLPYRWVVLTGSLKPAGPDYLALGYSGTVTVKTLKEVSGPDQGERPEKADVFQAALIAAIHHFAADGELDHLRAVLDQHPKLVNAKQIFRQPRKPVRTDGFTALHYAAERGRSQVVSYLIEKGAEVNSDDGLGWTPLHLAAQQGHLPVVKQLVKAGAKVDAKTVAIPEQFAVGPGAPDARPQRSPAIPSLTPLELAKEAKHQEVVGFLKGAK